MRSVLLALALSLATGCSAQTGEAPRPPAPPQPVLPVEPPNPAPVPDETAQMLLVVTPSWDATSGALRRYERENGEWTAVGEPVPVVVGRSGLGWGRGLHGGVGSLGPGPQKREGDGRAPAGVFDLSAAFGYADAEPTGLPYVASTPEMVCVDDGDSGAYNLVIDRTTVANDWGSRERMRLETDLYRIGVIVAHNGPGVAQSAVADRRAGPDPVPGGGSCIFLHVWRGPDSVTAGCTAMPDERLQKILAWLDAEQRPVLVQLPAAQAERLASDWDLPTDGL